jgi:predicted nucleotidyltransferase
LSANQPRSAANAFNASRVSSKAVNNEQSAVNHEQLLINNGALCIDRKQLAQLCQRWQIEKLELFGSAVRDDFNEASDIDLLATFSPNARITFFDLDTIEQELSAILNGRPIDLTTRRAIEQSHNPIRRQNILSHTREIFPNEPRS